MGVTLHTHLEAMIAHNLITFENNFMGVNQFFISISGQKIGFTNAAKQMF
jgi:hypothetical protein